MKQQAINHGENLRLSADEWNRLRVAFGLSSREADILRCLVEDVPTDKQIGTILRIKPGTVRKHMANLRAKFGVTTRVQLVEGVWAFCRCPDATPRRGRQENKASVRRAAGL